MINEAYYVELGLACADICQALDQEIRGGKQPGSSALREIGQLTA